MLIGVSISLLYISSFVILIFTGPCQGKFFYDTYHFYRYDLFGLKGPGCPMKTVRIPS